MADTCDGTKNRGTRNCSAPASWRIKKKDEIGEPYLACSLHLGQVGSYILDGEQGKLEVICIRTLER